MTEAFSPRDITRLRRAFQSRRLICTHCGNPAESLDHTPPRSFFPAGVSDMVSVPACLACNNGSSLNDEVFRNIVGLAVGNVSEEASYFWHKKALPGIRHNKKSHLELLSKAQKVLVFSPSGLLVGVSFSVGVEAVPIRSVVSRIVRGLYLNNFGGRLLASTGIDIDIVDQSGLGFQQWLEELLPVLSARSIGTSSRFEYLFGRAAEAPQDSMWLLRFYGSYLVRAFTSPSISVRACAFNSAITSEKHTMD